MRNAVLFDFAGTLFMPAPAAEVLGRAAAGLGLKLPRAQLEELAAEYERAGIPGGPYPEEVPAPLAALYAERDLSPQAHRRAYVGLLASVDQPFSELPDAFYSELLSPGGWMPYSDALPVVEALRARGVEVGLISNIGFDLRGILHHHGFGMLTEAATLSFEAGVTKPDPELFRAALRTIERHPAQTLMVGDHPEADGGGVSLGMVTLILPMTPAGTRHGLELILELL